MNFEEMKKNNFNDEYQVKKKELDHFVKVILFKILLNLINTYIYLKNR